MEKVCYDTHHYTISPTMNRRDILPLRHRCVGARVYWITIDDNNYDGQVLETTHEDY